jgi:NAD(P)-dependent dehydrogenase (short-subunit alcohol dehydrogenase family)
VNVSSEVGSFARLLTPGRPENAVTLPVYPATKAALTMLTVQYARSLDGILVKNGPTGTFQDRYGTVPW